MAALDGSPETCLSSQEFLKNNSLVPPSKPVPPSFSSPQEKKKKNPVPKCGYFQGTSHRTKTPN